MIAAGLLALALQVGGATAADSPRAACYRREVRGGTTLATYIGDRQCLRLAAPRVFEGVWLNDFEGSRFLEGAATAHDVRASPRRIWLNRHELLKPAGSAWGPYGRAYRIRFVGRAAPDGKAGITSGYGHFGMSDGLIVMDELIEMTDIGASVETRPKP